MNQYEKTVQDISDFFVIGKEHVISMLKGWLDLGYSLLVAEMIATDILSRKTKKEKSNLTNEHELISYSKQESNKYSTNIWLEIYHESLYKYPNNKSGIFLSDDDISNRHPKEDEIGLSTRLFSMLSAYHLFYLKNEMLVTHQKLMSYDLFRKIIYRYFYQISSKSESILAEHFLRLIILNGYPSENSEIKNNLRNIIVNVGKGHFLSWTASVFETFIFASDVLNAMMKVNPSIINRYIWKYKLDKNFRKTLNISVAFLFMLLVLIFKNNFLGMIGYHNIKYSDVKVVNNSGIGNDWTFQVMINGQRLNKGGTKYLGKSDFPVEINVTATEIDKYSDVGTASIVINNIYNSYKEVIPVIVRETKGRGSGSSASVEFLILIH